MIQCMIWEVINVLDYKYLSATSEFDFMFGFSVLKLSVGIIGNIRLLGIVFILCTLKE